MILLNLSNVIDILLIILKKITEDNLFNQKILRKLVLTSHFSLVGMYILMKGSILQMSANQDRSTLHMRWEEKRK